MVECQLPKLDVAGSSPVSRSITFSAALPGFYPNNGGQTAPELIKREYHFRSDQEHRAPIAQKMWTDPAHAAF